ncbi:MAG: response regulator [Planctomycetes bacterium]|nr:response regulator [Planctomycetota bacterium]
MQASHSKVLVVEDDTQILLGLYKRLTRAGFDVLAASCGHAAIECARTYLPDVMTLDVRLPDVDGIEVASILRDGSRTARIPIVFITAKVDRDLRDAAEEAGRHRFFIRKPYDPELLIQLLNSMLARDELAGIQQISKAKRRQPVASHDWPTAGPPETQWRPF